MKRLILIDDSEEIYHLVRMCLGRDCTVTWAKSIADAQNKFRSERFDLILLDVLLPDGDGFSLCAQLQKNERTLGTPIIFVTAKTGVPNLVTGLSLGAEDYIEKPFDPLELRARVEVKLLKSAQAKQAESVLFRGDLQIHLENQAVILNRSSGPVRLSLTPIEFKLLHCLAKHENVTHSREQLMAYVWGEGISVSDRTVDKHISSLRRKLEHASDCIETVPGFGYLFSSQIKQRKAS